MLAAYHGAFGLADSSVGLLGKSRLPAELWIWHTKTLETIVGHPFKRNEDIHNHVTRSITLFAPAK